MEKEKLDKDDMEIDRLAKKRILQLLKMEPTNEDLKIFYAKLKAAQLGLVYKRDREIMRRVSDNQSIRIVTLITSDANERKKYLQVTMPEMKLLTTPCEVSHTM